MNKHSKQIVIVGGGASGCFAAARHKALFPENHVLLLEKSQHLLGKVKVSGGGRCNLTHHCIAVPELLKAYPRGARELNSPFRRFGPMETMAWFEERGVPLKTEPDGRVFPVSDSSQSIIDCLVGEMERVGVEVRRGVGLKALAPQKEGGWILHSMNGETLFADAVMLATGSNPSIWKEVQALGHTIVEPVPSLFTFHIQDDKIADLSGLSLPFSTCTIKDTKIKTEGALLITHWGLSGPAVLKASAWGARLLADMDYHFVVSVHWDATLNREDTLTLLRQTQKKHPLKRMDNFCPFAIPIRLWKKLLKAVEASESLIYADSTKKLQVMLAEMLCDTQLEVRGKSTFKEEFVTSGGISLKEIDFKTMQSKMVPSLYFGGEILDIDAITGGFNFQNAWTTGWIVGENI